MGGSGIFEELIPDTDASVSVVNVRHLQRSVLQNPLTHGICNKTKTTLVTSSRIAGGKTSKPLEMVTRRGALVNGSVARAGINKFWTQIDKVTNCTSVEGNQIGSLALRVPRISTGELHC